MRATVISIAVLSVALLACGGGGATNAPAGTGTPAATSTAAGTGGPAEDASFQLADSDYGQILTDAEGFTLYVFVPDDDAGGEPTCYDDCAANWPPVEAIDPVTVGEGLETDDFASVERTDGTTQATFNGLPIYYFANDAAPGDTNGQALNEVWYVVGADGEMITTAPEAS